MSCAVLFLLCRDCGESWPCRSCGWYCRSCSCLDTVLQILFLLLDTELFQCRGGGASWPCPQQAVLAQGRGSSWSCLQFLSAGCSPALCRSSWYCRCAVVVCLVLCSWYCRAGCGTLLRSSVLLHLIPPWCTWCRDGGASWPCRCTCIGCHVVTITVVVSAVCSRA